MLLVIVVNLISCVVIATFCSFSSRKTERKNADEEQERRDALLMISDNFLDPDDPESASLRGVSSDVVFPNTITTSFAQPSPNSPSSSSFVSQ